MRFHFGSITKSHPEAPRSILEFEEVDSKENLIATKEAIFGKCKTQRKLSNLLSFVFFSANTVFTMYLPTLKMKRGTYTNTYIQWVLMSGS